MARTLGLIRHCDRCGRVRSVRSLQAVPNEVAGRDMLVCKGGCIAEVDERTGVLTTTALLLLMLVSGCSGTVGSSVEGVSSVEPQVVHHVSEPKASTEAPAESAPVLVVDAGTDAQEADAATDAGPSCGPVPVPGVGYGCQSGYELTRCADGAAPPSGCVASEASLGPWCCPVAPLCTSTMAGNSFFCSLNLVCGSADDVTDLNVYCNTTGLCTCEKTVKGAVVDNRTIAHASTSDCSVALSVVCGYAL